jgi:hypothetical protein
MQNNSALLNNEKKSGFVGTNKHSAATHSDRISNFFLIAGPLQMTLLYAPMAIKFLRFNVCSTNWSRADNCYAISVLAYCSAGPADFLFVNIGTVALFQIALVTL